MIQTKTVSIIYWTQARRKQQFIFQSEYKDVMENTHLGQPLIQHKTRLKWIILINEYSTLIIIL